ncbi:ribosome biogenesis factor YjgA [Hydrogenovibrio kuenenii]|uniref:ribosome biogenesis factor YjgA n=1 Tax=Hydrogenovibrio kuenenii TaxID=63658 RepID=UPI000463C350|nr:ribosome biogenesis factor YjgA [Hydrogenovibrio kuenenii]
MVRPRNVNRTKAPKTVPDWEQEEFESRTDIKKAAQAVTDLGEKLAEMTESKIRTLNLPDELLNAILLLKRLDKGPAVKRQKAFVGKFLRKNEYLIVDIKEKLMEEELKAQQQNAHFQRLEKWRDRLVEEGDDALNEFIEVYPQVDRSFLRQAIRNAQKEAEQNKPPKSSRAIFKYLRGLEW